jgi:hypothetical protein
MGTCCSKNSTEVDSNEVDSQQGSQSNPPADALDAMKVKDAKFVSDPDQEKLFENEKNANIFPEKPDDI